MNLKICAMAAAALTLAACGKERAGVRGTLVGHSGGKIYLEQVIPGDQRIVDSAELGRRGQFRFGVKLPAGQATLYNLRHKDQAIPLLLSPGERIVVNSMCDIAINYTISGSEESERIRNLQMLLTHGGLRLDSLRRVILNSSDEVQRKAYVEYVNDMNEVKREHIKFIVSEPGRLSSLYALYQRLAGERHLFTAENDVIYYRLVADSTAAAHPGSPYVAALQREVQGVQKALDMQNALSEKWQSGGDNFPDLTMPDIYGAMHTLSALSGKVVLVDFWHSADPASRLNNAELRKLYEGAHERGFEVYQVSFDTQKAAWVQAVQAQKLPWIEVCDLLGSDGPAAVRYNVSRLPTNFLIDRTGTIVGRDLFGTKLTDAVEKAL